MIIKQDTPDIVSSGFGEELEFGMEDANYDIIFDILRTKIYKNNIGSICREIASNSRDAQREKGNGNVPIEVEITDRTKSLWLEDGLNIIFRDYGVGISPERMKTVYRMYGGSTKRLSNDQTGGFGLGAKTPFSYIDAFGVRTVVDNIEYTYHIYIDETRKGKIALITSGVVAPQSNMTEVVIPILSKNNDRAKFEKEMLKNTHFWSVRPILKNFDNDGKYEVFNNSKISLKSIPASIKGDYDIFDKTGFLESHVNVVIDGIYYPVDTNLLDVNIPDRFRSAFVFYFDNGVLNVAANRETLQYDDTTISILNGKVNDLIDIIRMGYEDEFKNCQTMLDALKLYSNASESGDLFMQLVSDKTGLTYNINGEDIKLSSFSKNFKVQGHKISQVSYETTYNGERRVGRTRDYNPFKSELINKYISTGKAFYISAADSRNDRLSPAINRTLLARHSSFLLVEEHTDAAFNKSVDSHLFYKLPEFVKNDWELLKHIGLKNYWDVVPDKTVRNARDNSIVSLKTWLNGNEDRRNFTHNGAYFTDVKDIEIKSFVYIFIEREISLTNTQKEYISSLSRLMNIVVPGMKLVVNTKLKDKYFENYTSIEEWIYDNSDKVADIINRVECDNWIYKARQYVKCPLLPVHADFLNSVVVFARKIVGNPNIPGLDAFFSERMPNFKVQKIDFSAGFDALFKTYPHLNAVNAYDSSNVNKYVEMVNELEAYREKYGNI